MTRSITAADLGIPDGLLDGALDDRLVGDRAFELPGADRHRVAVCHLGLEGAEVPHVLVVHVDVDEAVALRGEGKRRAKVGVEGDCAVEQIERFYSGLSVLVSTAADGVRAALVVVGPTGSGLYVGTVVRAEVPVPVRAG